MSISKWFHSIILAIIIFGLMLTYFNCGSGFSTDFDSLENDYQSNLSSVSEKYALEDSYTDDSLINLFEKVKNEKVFFFNGIKTFSEKFEFNLLKIQPTEKFISLVYLENEFCEKQLIEISINDQLITQNKFIFDALIKDNNGCWGTFFLESDHVNLNLKSSDLILLFRFNEAGKQTISVNGLNNFNNLYLIPVSSLDNESSTQSSDSFEEDTELNEQDATTTNSENKQKNELQDINACYFRHNLSDDYEIVHWKDIQTKEQCIDICEKMTLNSKKPSQCQYNGVVVYDALTSIQEKKESTPIVVPEETTKEIPMETPVNTPKETPVPSKKIYQVYSENKSDTIVVSSMDALENAINTAPANRNILVAPGVYNGGNRTFNPRGSEGKPIVVRPQNGYGSVTINSASWTLKGSWFVLSKMHFNNPRISINQGATFNRITRNRFRQIGGTSIHVFEGKYIRVDHNDWSEYLSTTSSKGLLRLRHTNVGNGSCKYILFDRNWVHDITPSVGVNGMEPVGLTSSGGNAAGVFPEFTIEYNLFDNINLPSDAELIGAKTSGIVFYRNTVINMGSACYINSPRQGEQFRMIENWFENVKKTDFILLFSRKSELIGNRLIGKINANITPGDFYWAGTNDSGYPACDECRVVGNKLDSGYLQIGNYRQKSPPPKPARNTNLWDNVRSSGGLAHKFNSGYHIGTTFNKDSISYTPAVKLTKSDVGPLAP